MTLHTTLAFALLRLDDKTSDEHFNFTEQNNLLNNIISNTATTQMRERCLQVE
jgi:hypothetical protein